MKRFSVILLLSGIAFAALSFYLITQLPQLNYLGRSNGYKISTALFLGGAFQLLIGLLLAKPISKTYHVQNGNKEYRDPFVGLDREELSDHGYGAETSEKNSIRKWQGATFSLPGILMILGSVFFD